MSGGGGEEMGEGGDGGEEIGGVIRPGAVGRAVAWEAREVRVSGGVEEDESEQ